MEPTVFRLWPQRVLDGLRERVQQAVLQWHAAWSLPLTAVVANCRAAEDAMTRTEALSLQWARVEGLGWQATSPRFGADLHPVVVYAATRVAQGGATIGGELAQRATRALVEACSRAIDPRAPSAQDPRGNAETWLPRRGRGDVLLEVMVGFETLYLVLAGETVQRLTPSARQALPPLGRVDLRRGARTSSCTVRALLGAAEADIANLATLEIGDVLRLEQRVDKPLRVIDDSWRVICGAALGQCAGHLAVSLMKAPELEMTP